MNYIELTAGVLFFSNYLLAATSVLLCVLLYRHYRRCGWLVLGGAFMTPLFLLCNRIAHGWPVLTYRQYSGQDPDHAVRVTYHFDIPSYYLVVVLALWLLLRAARKDRP